jgi:hypothetical protein
MTTPTPPEDGGTFGEPQDLSPPPPAGPWASDSLPPHPLAAYGPPMERPPSIRTAVTLMYVGAGLAALQIVVVLLLIGSIRDEIRDDNPDLTASEVDTRANVGLAFAVVFALIGVGLWLWMAHENGAGKSWARTVATVFGVLGILATLLRLAGSGMGVNLLGLVNLVLAIVILVFLYRPDASAYYRSRSAY